MEEMKTLIKQLQKLSYEYYTLGQPSVSDETYDSLYDKLLQLEKETGIALSNSPTQQVGNVVLDKLQKVTHEYPLLSLDKTKDINVLAKFTKDKEGILQLKLDGLTIDNTYENGILVRSETRGNGEIGEDITENSKTFTNLPLIIPYKGKVHIIGESIITYDVFEEINSKLAEDKKYMNPRNLVSGSVRQLNNNICKQRKVKFIGYIVEGRDDLLTKESQLDFIQEQGFDVVLHANYSNNGKSTDMLQAIIDKMKQYAKDNLIPIDGLVMQYNDIKYGKSLGSTSHHPLHSIAFKFSEDVEISVLRDIEWQVGRTGQITPVAIFNEIELAGTTVTRASLHNLTILKSFKLGIGDEIAVVKKNEIIPQIIDNLTKSDTLEIINTCPECGEKLTTKKDNESEVLMCTNDNCKAKLVQKISHYASRNALNIEGFSEATIEKFVELGFIKKIKDIYNLEGYKKQIIKLDGFGSKSYNNLIQAIEKSKQCKLESFIFGLGISNVGKSTAKTLVEFAKSVSGIDTLKNILDLQVSDLMRMKDCGGVIANSIYKWFSDKGNRELLEYITTQLTFIEDKPKETKEGVFTGKTIYATGTFANYKKNELKELIESNGGTFASGYAKSLSYLVVGSVKGSSKVDKANKDGITVLTEEEFKQIIKGN